jgi:hypothetical protein
MEKRLKSLTIAFRSIQRADPLATGGGTPAAGQDDHEECLAYQQTF